MGLRDNLKTAKAKERYDRNYNSIDITFTQKELYEHDKEIRNKAIDEFVEKLLENAPRNWAGGLELGGATCYLSANKVKEIAEQMKGDLE